MLVGKAPFSEQSAKATFDRISKLEYAIPDSISPNVADLIQRLLNTDTNERISLKDVLKHPFMQEPENETDL
jgi:serine/threonine protein kinase